METDDLAKGLVTARTKYELSDALDRISRHHERVALGHLIEEYLSDSRWLVRHSAIRGIANCSNVDVEGLLLELVDRSADPHDLAYANAALGRRGTHRSLNYLASAIAHKKEDVATSAVRALSRIGSVEQLPIILSALEDRRWAVKWYAMIAVEEHGNGSAVGPVLRRVKKILGRDRKIVQGPRSELTAGLAFLWRYRSGNNDVMRLFDEYLPARRYRLQPEEEAALVQLESGSEASQQGNATDDALRRS